MYTSKYLDYFGDSYLYSFQIYTFLPWTDRCLLCLTNLMHDCCMIFEAQNNQINTNFSYNMYLPTYLQVFVMLSRAFPMRYKKIPGASSCGYDNLHGICLDIKCFSIVDFDSTKHKVVLGLTPYAPL